jgi:WD40 repeat protein
MAMTFSNCKVSHGPEIRHVSWGPMHPGPRKQSLPTSCDVDDDEVLDEASEVLDPLIYFSPHLIDRRQTYITEVAVAGDVRVLAASLATFSIEIYMLENADRFKHIGTLVGHRNTVTGLSLGATANDPLFSSSEDGCVKEWDLISLTEVHRHAPLLPHTTCFSAIHPPNNSQVPVGDDYPRLILACTGWQLVKAVQLTRASFVVWRSAQQH